MNKFYAILLAVSVAAALQYINLNMDTFEYEGGIYRTLSDGSAVLVWGNDSLPKTLPFPEEYDVDMEGIAQADDGTYYLTDLVLPEEDIPKDWRCGKIDFYTNRCCSPDGNECELFED